MMKLLLLTISNCSACKRLKQNLDMLQSGLIDFNFEYEIVNIEKHPEYAVEYDMQSAPVLVFPTGYTLRYSPGMKQLRNIVEDQFKEYADQLI